MIKFRLTKQIISYKVRIKDKMYLELNYKYKILSSMSNCC